MWERAQLRTAEDERTASGESEFREEDFPELSS
jgi:hypothetical protein